jgi:hypothetical protein
MQATRGSRDITPTHLHLGTTWGEWSASRPGRALPPGKDSPVPIAQEAGWAPKPVWTHRLKETSFVSVINNDGQQIVP